MTKIPKIIHYCWFGGNPYPTKLKKYIETCHKFLPNYKFVLWNEDNFNIENSCQYVIDAYKEKKYAFVSDYVRLYALYQYGGIYLDTDIEMIKAIPPEVLCDELVFSLDDGGYIAGSFIASTANNQVIGKLIETYIFLSFYNDDGSLNLEVNNTYIQKKLIELGYKYQQINRLQRLKDEIVLYPDDYFHCRSLTTGKINISENSVAIHWHSILWASTKTKFINFIRINLLVPIMGRKLYSSITNKIKNGKTTI